MHPGLVSRSEQLRRTHTNRSGRGDAKPAVGGGNDLCLRKTKFFRKGLQSRLTNIFGKALKHQLSICCFLMLSHFDTSLLLWIFELTLLFRIFLGFPVVPIKRDR